MNMVEVRRNDGDSKLPDSRRAPSWITVGKFHRTTNIEADNLYHSALELEETDPDTAIALFERIIKEYPDEMDEWGAGDRIGYSNEAKNNVEFLRCRRDRPEVTSESPQKFIEMIRSAAEAKDEELLASYPICGFYYGPIELYFVDSGEMVPGDDVKPEMIARFVIQHASDVAWEKAERANPMLPLNYDMIVPLREPIPGYPRYEPKTPMKNFEFFFRERDGGVVWTGVNLRSR